jgi:hypothetical protein
VVNRPVTQGPRTNGRRIRGKEQDMPAAAWVTLIIAALIIGITAVGLLRVIFHLRAIRATLVSTTGGVQAVARLTSTVPDRLTSVNANLKPVRDFCETV